MSQKKISAIIQARFSSTRLKGKVLKPLPYDSEQTMLGQIVTRLSASRFQPAVILATSINPADDVLAAWAGEQNIPCFRGHEQHVLSRFQEVGRSYGIDTMIRITADNPFIDPELLDDVLEKHLDSRSDYTCSSGLPLGMNIEVIETAAILQLESQVLLPEDEEHVTLAIRKQPNKFAVQTVHMSRPADTNWRLTVDNVRDYSLACCIYDELYPDDPCFGLDKIEALMAKKPWISWINAGSVQKQSGLTSDEELRTAIRILEEQELFKVVTLLRRIQP